MNAGYAGRGNFDYCCVLTGGSSGETQGRPMIDCGDSDVLLESAVGKLKIEGSGNTVRIGASSTLGGLEIQIRGSNNSLEIESGRIFGGAFFGFERVNNSKIRIGRRTTAGSGFSIQIHEQSDVTLGDDCMLSTGVFISSTDMHPIFDLATGERINVSRSIHIGDHVWLGRNVSVQKGAVIGDGAIIGQSAIVNKSIGANCLAVGMPAKTIREGVEWKRNFSDLPSASSNSMG